MESYDPDDVRPAKAGDDRPSVPLIERPEGPAIEFDLPDELPITAAERRLVAAYFTALITRILAEDP